MGCSSSHENEENSHDDSHQPSENQFAFMTPALGKLLASKNPIDLLKAFLLLDKSITEEENRNPSSHFGQAMSRQEHIKSLLQSAMEMKNQNEILSGEFSVYDLFLDLGLVKNPRLALEHEEFFASINRRAISQNAMNILHKIVGKVENDIKTSSERLSQLQSAYHQQDELLGQVFGETYGSDTERLLEKELDTMRYYRDMLSTGVLQWEVCADNTRTAVDLLEKGVSCWKSIQKESLERKISLATEARNAFQEAVLLIKTSEELLQDVQFPYCTTRELKRVSQAMDYVFTDILIEEGYLHASQVYENFLQSASSLYEWVREVLNSKLQKDLLEIEKKVSEAASQLKTERIYLICKKLKIQSFPEELLTIRGEPSPPILKNYFAETKGGTVLDFDKLPVNVESKLAFRRDESVQNYLKKIVENRKNTMWPSRRIDELPSLMVQQ